MNSDLSILQLILGASVVVQLVLLLLLIASIASWAVIIDKARLLKQAHRAAAEFETSFWSGVDLSSLYRDIARTEATPLGMAGIFEAGFREFGRLKQEAGMAADQVIEGARRAMRVSQMREMDRIEHNLAFLATVSNTSPYVGLFGTVWGIMSAFYSLGSMASATIAVVAPHISEALIATAMGLFAAIPAGIFFNRYANQVNRLEVRYDTFSEELSSILQRNAGARRPPPAHGARGRAMSRQKHRLMSEINVVPYIDVMLVLLIIFMITAPLLTQGITVDLPKAPAEALDPELLKDNEPVVLSIDKEGSFFLNIGGKDTDTAIDEATVVERVSAVLRRNPQTPVLVKGDQNVPYGRVVTGMTLLTQAGAPKVGFLTEPPAVDDRRQRGR
jgi:biopolymer transport protein TolQ